MPLTLTLRVAHWASLAIACVLLAGPAQAESAFVSQAFGRAHSNASMMAFAVPVTPATSPNLLPTTRTAVLRPSPELAAPATSGHNYASTLQIGRANSVLQAQFGANNYSAVGILNGSYNSVGVLQSGHSLVSNLLLLNTRGLSVGVIQPNGSAPVNMLIARLPNGALLIKR